MTTRSVAHVDQLDESSADRQFNVIGVRGYRQHIEGKGVRAYGYYTPQRPVRQHLWWATSRFIPKIRPGVRFQLL
jgi:hypothetical protein